LGAAGAAKERGEEGHEECEAHMEGNAGEGGMVRARVKCQGTSVKCQDTSVKCQDTRVK
jgi:hypothetical protein